MSSATIVTVNDLLSHREKMSPDYKTLIPRLTDSVALIGHVQKELSFKQRDEIQPYLNQEFKQAFSRTLSLESSYLVRNFPRHDRSLRQLIS